LDILDGFDHECLKIPRGIKAVKYNLTYPKAKAIIVECPENEENVQMFLLDDDNSLLTEISIPISKGFYEGQVLSKDKVKELSELPGREQLIARLLHFLVISVSHSSGCNIQKFCGAPVC